MIVTHKISMHLDSVDQEQSIQIVQNDSNARALEVSLYENGAAWPVPEGTTVVFRYLKPDGTNGEYDTLADGTQAWNWEGNVVTVRLLGALSSMTGVVHCTLVLQQAGATLHSFALRILVQPDLTGVAVVSDTLGGTGTGGSSGTDGIACMLQGLSARVGQVLRVAAVNYAGTITALEAADLTDTVGLPLPERATVGQSIFVAAVDEYGKVTKTEARDVEALASAEEGSF